MDSLGYDNCHKHEKKSNLQIVKYIFGFFLYIYSKLVDNLRGDFKNILLNNFPFDLITMERKSVVLFVWRVNEARPTASSIQFDSFTSKAPFIRTFRSVMALLQFL